MFRSLIPTSALLVVLAAACSSPAATSAPTTQPTVAASPSAAATLGYTVALAPGGFFVGPTGLSLYTFDKDAPGTSSCTSGKCHDNWPPLALASGAQVALGAGLDESDFATIAWPDGTTQVTFKDIPLYYFAGDQAVGQTNGEGVGGVWHLATNQSTLPVPSVEPSASASAAVSIAPSTPPTSGGSSAPSPQASICHDEYDYEVPCPSDAASGPTVSVSAEGNLVNSAGMSLYTFDKDTTENISACTGECLVNWPALTIETGQAVSVGDGVDLEDFTTFTRTDDTSTQVAYYAKPLYTFIGDAAPGDTNGDGVSGIWHLAKPQ